jgi:hypothetical protein
MIVLIAAIAVLLIVLVIILVAMYLTDVTFTPFPRYSYPGVRPVPEN